MRNFFYNIINSLRTFLLIFENICVINFTFSWIYIFKKKDKDIILLILRSDTIRLNVLMNYGGIYFDNDVYVIKPLHEFRKYEMTVSWDVDDQSSLGVQVLIAHRNARLIKAHFDMYR